jgi:potassium/hydrogen antiporter
VPGASRLYGIVVIVVVFSVIIQGGLVPAVARLLRLPMRIIEPEPWSLGVRLRDEPDGVHRLTVGVGAPADGSTISNLVGFPSEAWVTLLVRDGQLMAVRGDTRLQAGDTATVLADSDRREELVATLERPASTAGDATS